MKSLGKKSDGLRLARIQASPLWTGERFSNLHPVLPGLRDSTVALLFKILVERGLPVPEATKVD